MAKFEVTRTYTRKVRFYEVYEVDDDTAEDARRWIELEFKTNAHGAFLTWRKQVVLEGFPETDEDVEYAVDE